MKTINSCLLLVLPLFFVFGCSRSNPQLIEEKSTTSSNSELQSKAVIDEAQALDIVLDPKSDDKKIREIAQNYKSGLSWSHFWDQLGARNKELSRGNFKNLSYLSILECSKDNTKSFLNFLEKYIKNNESELMADYLTQVGILAKACGKDFGKGELNLIAIKIDENQNTIQKSNELLKTVFSLCEDDSECR